MTSTWEAFPISIIEAMASGIPYISTDVGVVKFLPGGVIIKNQKELQHWIEFIINNEDIAKKIGAIGKTYADLYLNKNKQIDKLENILYSTIKNK